MALDHPDRLERLALFDVITTADAFGRADAKFTLAYWPWSLLAQPAPQPEALIAAALEAVVDNALASWGSGPVGLPCL